MTLYAHTEATLVLMGRSPVIPVLTVRDAADAVSQARALADGGLPIVEVTLRTPDALAGIAAIRRSLPQVTVGAGTIVEVAQIEAAMTAGAAFLVSPGATPGLAETASRSPIPFLPGMATASEAMLLMEYGFRAMKFFPAEAAGGTRQLASLAGPFGDLRFCPTGGIDLDKARAYLALTNVVCVGGSWMLPKSAIETSDFGKIEMLAREAAALSRPA
jgi:2-dehydro-3-deoxyphosphogluconate aldolase/(4S)-4-hydroxy-2-oxoglutarate aldolase